MFFNDTATTEIYALSLHDALPICDGRLAAAGVLGQVVRVDRQLGGQVLAEDVARRLGVRPLDLDLHVQRSEEHTSELQSRQYLVCRLLLENHISRARPLPRVNLCT